MQRPLLLCLLILSLAGCAARGVITLLPELDGQGTDLQRVFIASNRLSGSDDASQFIFEQDFGDVRDPNMRYGSILISIPPGHRTGNIEWPGAEEPDPQRHFVASDQRTFADARAFLQALDARDRQPREVVVFVHGYNVNNAEAVYRLAQIAQDFDAKVPVIAFSWPSAGNPRGYVYDRDSVMFSRDDLETLLSALTGPGDRKVLLVAHSMGSQLVMETLRQMAISGNRGALADISGVALISPDIDEDVFVQQARRITPFPQPFTLMVSDRDRALNLSAFLTGKPARLGSITDPGRLGNLPVQVVDLSDIEGGDRGGHTTAFTAPAAIRLLRDLATGASELIEGAF